MEQKKLPIKINYRLDQFLMYLIQDVTGRPSAEIMNFFHELCTQVAEIGLENKTGKSIKKRINDYFPGSSIPFRLELDGRPQYGWDPVKRQRTEGQVFECYAEVGFPNKTSFMKEDDLKAIATFLMERDLLGADLPADIKPFERPETSSPKMYRDLMDRFAGRPVAEKRRRVSKDAKEQV